MRINTLILAIVFALPAVVEARRDRLDLRHQAIELPGAPSAILPADVDGDGRQDLVVAVAYTEWDQIGIEETVAMDDIDGLVEVLTIVPSLMDRRELWVFLGQEGGGYRPLAQPMVLDSSVLTFDHGPPGQPIVALTDDGLAALRLTGESDARHSELVPIVSDRSILTRTGTFVPDLGLAHDLDGDGQRDLLFPTFGGAAIYLSRAEQLAPAAASRPSWPTTHRKPGARLSLYYPLPEVRDVNGDQLPDLLLPDRRKGWQRFHLLLNEGDGRFAPPATPLGDDEEDDTTIVITVDAAGNAEVNGEPKEEENDHGQVVYFGDIDGDGVAEVVTQRSLAGDEDGMRKEMREAKRPPFRYRLFRTLGDLSMAPEPYLEFNATGYAFDGDSDTPVPGGFQDLDGDGRQDLVTLTLDFSLMQAVRVLTTRRISIGLDFHVWCQNASGEYRAVPGLDLSGKFKLDLNNFKVGQLSQFAGDFDADGKADFVQMGRGRDVTIHRGREGCVYPPEPDLLIRLKEEPRDLKLVQVRDFDADELTDLLVIQPQKVTEPGVTPPVRLDLYLSGGAQ